VRPIPVLLLALAVAGCVTAPPRREFSVFFTGGSAALDPPAIDVVADAARAADRFPTLPVTVAGYAGAHGTPKSELELAGLRARAVEERLVADGVPASRLRRAEQAPVSYPATPVESRRVDISIGEAQARP